MNSNLPSLVFVWFWECKVACKLSGKFRRGIKPLILSWLLLEGVQSGGNSWPLACSLAWPW